MGELSFEEKLRERIRNVPVFEEGKKYIFKRKLVKFSTDNYERGFGCRITISDWYDDIDGAEVFDIVDNYVGKCYSKRFKKYFYVNRNWCVEVVE